MPQGIINMDNKIIFRIFIAILAILENKKYKTKYIIYSTLFIFSFNNYKRLYTYVQINLIKIILVLIAGYIIGIIITSLNSWIFYGTKMKFFVSYLSIQEVLTILEEEFFWRSFMYGIANIMDKSFILIYICIVSLAFVIMHKINNIIDLFEMYLYTLLISISFFFEPTFSIGLHLSRNALLNYNSEDGKIENRK